MRGLPVPPSTRSRRLPTPSAPALLLGIALAFPPAGAVAGPGSTRDQVDEVPTSTPETGASFELPADPSAVVVEYHEIVGMIAAEDRGPSLLIRADGSGVVHFPVYMRRAGTYELRIPTSELRELVGSLVAEGLVEMDPAAMRRARERAEAEAGRRAREEEAALAAVSDESKSVVTLRLAEYRQVPGGPVQSDVEKTVVWHGLRSDAERFPGLPGLAGLQRVTETLEAYLTHPGLIRLDEDDSSP